MLDERDWEEFKGKLRRKTEIDLDLYKAPQMQRRIMNLARRNGYDTYSGYFDHVVQDKDDFAAFIDAIDKCKGDVYLETKEGDVLNLKSKLCQMIGLSTILKHTEIEEATVSCKNPDDETMLFRFNLYGEAPEKE